MKRSFPILAATLLGSIVFAGAACDGTTPTASIDPADAGTEDAAATCEAIGNGTLDIQITGLPEGLLPSVSVDDATPPLTASGIVAVSAGVHRVSASVVTQSGDIVRRAFGASLDVSAPCVRSDQATKVAVSYSLIPTSDTLWATHANTTGDFAGFAGSALSASATSPAKLVSAGLTKSTGVAFDKVGNLWVTDNASIKRFPASGFSGTAVTPQVVLTGDAFNGGIPGPAGIAFDKSGNLWVSLVASKKIVKIAAANLETTQTVTPSVTLDGAVLDGVGALAFDANGNLYATTASHVVRYNQARLSASTSDAPDLILEAKTPEPVVSTLSSPSGLAFDSDGGLWVAYFAANTIAHFTPSELGATATATVTPAIQIVVDVTALLEGIAFDESKGLWVTYKAGQVARLAPAQLTATGTVVPETIVTGTGVGTTASVTFFPAPLGLPLFSAIP